MFKYRNYVAKIEPDIDTDMLHGRVLNIGDAVTGDIISFEGKTVKEAERAFHRSVDAYIEFCRRREKNPTSPFQASCRFAPLLRFTEIYTLQPLALIKASTPGWRKP